MTKPHVKGVRWDSKRGQWHAQIQINGKKHYLGRWDKWDDAVRARRRGEKKRRRDN